jgi:hypothetical protein
MRKRERLGGGKCERECVIMLKWGEVGMVRGKGETEYDRERRELK